MTVNGEKLRQIMGSFATGCTIVTLPTKPPHGMTANAFSSVSLDPPLCLVCVDQGTTTYEHLQSGVDYFAVNVLSRDQLDIAEHFADINTLSNPPFESKPTTEAESGSLIFKDSLAYLDCKVENVIPSGDHHIYVGRILEGETLAQDIEPLTFFRGQWGTISSL